MKFRILIASAAVSALAACASLPAPVSLKEAGAGARAVDSGASSGMVSAADPRAAAAGVEMLRKGGSATDAAIATMLALNVVEPQNSGIGGGGFWVSLDGSSGDVSTIDGRETAPSAATPQWFANSGGKPLDPRQAYIGGKAAGVPGAVAMMAAAHAKSGKLPWSELFQPAIRLARDGFVVSPRMHNGIALYGRHMTGWARETYLPGGVPVAAGTPLHVPELATTLERIARDGAPAIYGEDSARRIAAAVAGAAANPAPMAATDVTSYKTHDRDPVCATYRAYRVCGMGPPSSGGITVLMILKQLERFDMRALGRGSPVAWHLIAESQRLAYADRNLYIADPGYVQVPVEGLLDPQYIASRSALIGEDKVMAEIRAGSPPGAPRRTPVPFRNDPGTSHLVAADPQGNAVSVTTTINGYYGSGIAVDGYMLNNEMPDFDMAPEAGGYLVANRVEGGKRPRSSMAPTIVFGPDGHVRLVIGAAGGATIICQVAKAIVGVLDWDLSAQDAIAMGLIYAPGSKVAVVEEGSDLVPLVPALRALGENVEIAPLGLKANAIEWKVSAEGGGWVGAADPRSEGNAMDLAGQMGVIERRANPLNGAHE